MGPTVDVRLLLSRAVQSFCIAQRSAPFSFAAAPGYHVADVVVDGVSPGDRLAHAVRRADAADTGAGWLTAPPRASGQAARRSLEKIRWAEMTTKGRNL